MKFIGTYNKGSIKIINKGENKKMKIENVLSMDMDVKLRKGEVAISTEVTIHERVAEILTDEQINKVENSLSEVVDILSKALVDDMKNFFGFNTLSSTLVKQDEIDEDIKEMEELYNNLSDEYKEKADKLIEDLKGLETPEERAKRVINELINNIFKA